jgi:hypothetical protein
MTVTSERHWSRTGFTPEEREVAAVMLDEMRVQDPRSPIFGYYDAKSQIGILVDAAIESWEPPITPDVAARAGQLAMIVREEQLSSQEARRR